MTCQDPPTVDYPKLVECPDCGGLGHYNDNDSKNQCRTCNGDGRYVLDRCPRQFVGSTMAQAVNLSSWATKGHLPEPGGILDQDAWFMSTWGALESETSLIEMERMERNR